MLNMPNMKLKKSVMTRVFLSLVLSAQMSIQVSANELVLTAEQYQSLGLQLAEAKQVSHYPTQYFPAQAMFHPKTTRTLSAPLSGKIARLNVVHGSVEKGQVIAEIESTELLTLQSQLLSVSSDLKVLQNELKRVKKLRQSGVSSEKILQQAQADVDKLQAEKDQQKKSLQLIGLSQQVIQRLLDSQSVESSVLSIVSPIDGQIFNVNVRLGERVSENQALFSLGETQPMLLKVKVPVTLANRLKEGQKVEVDSVGLAVIEHIDPDVDVMTQTVDVHVDVDNSNNAIRPGQRFQIRFLALPEANQQQNVYQIPSNAISQFEGETVVFVKENDVIQAKAITVMNMSGHMLYFTLMQPSSGTVEVFVKGSTAIKSAFEAAQESNAESDA